MSLSRVNLNLKWFSGHYNNMPATIQTVLGSILVIGLFVICIVTLITHSDWDKFHLSISSKLAQFELSADKTNNKND